MKTWSLLFTMLTGLMVMTPTESANAQSCHSSSYRTSSCGSCGGSVTYVLRTVGYDCHGCPIKRWVKEYHRCAPVNRCPDRHYTPPCESGHGHDSHRSSRGSRWGVQFSFGR